MTHSSERKINFRDANQGDVPAIYGLILKGYQRPLSSVQIKTYLPNFRVGEIDDVIVSCHLSACAGEIVTVQRFSVLPDYRREHIGVHTMMDLLSAAFEAQKLLVISEVPVDNIIGQLFLRAVTFTATRETNGVIRFERKLYDVLES